MVPVNQCQQMPQTESQLIPTMDYLYVQFVESEKKFGSSLMISEIQLRGFIVNMKLFFVITI